MSNLRINSSTCLELVLKTGIYDTRELLFQAGTDLTGILSNGVPHIFKEIPAIVLSKLATRVTFKGVPTGVPDEELLHVCKLYGTLVDGRVHREMMRLGSNNRYTISSSTRWVDVKLHQGNP